MNKVSLLCHALHSHSKGTTLQRQIRHSAKMGILNTSFALANGALASVNNNAPVKLLSAAATGVGIGNTLAYAVKLRFLLNDLNRVAKRAQKIYSFKMK